ncbi:WxL domain-containing protein [Enterococcus faecium]|uniref:WxL domain-containing protein n=1 Tax=Enterococcus faecium TaxID=1352 RepID=UPI0010FBDA38|nr:WxL domain-containing protein [Enterococcus faecium]QCS45673.1 WxL domain-containing protein [Enterococcus faecium]
MNFKKTSLLMGLSSILLITIVQENAYAEDKVKTTDGKIEILTGDGTEVIPPIEEPSEPGTGDKGPLSLDYISNLDFGKIKLSSGETTTKVSGPTDPEGNMLTKGLQVSDLRGTGAGWKVSIGLSAFSGTEDQTHTLKGAKVVLPEGAITTNNEDKKNGPVSNAKTIEAGGDASTIFIANKNQGMGTWFSKWDPEEVKLVVPGGQYADKYTAKLTWTLSDTPE